MKTSAITFFLALLITTASGRGNAIVSNKCSFAIYLYPTKNGTTTPTITLAPGKTFSQAYTYAPSSGRGDSIRISLATSSSNNNDVLEYIDSSSGILSWDLSALNGGIKGYNRTVKPSQISSSCKELDCPSSQSTCAGAYDSGNDDYATYMCPDSVNLVYTLCGPIPA